MRATRPHTPEQTEEATIKKVLTLALALIMVLSLASCGFIDISDMFGSTAVPGTSQPPEGYEKSFTILIDGSESWTPFDDGENVTFTNSKSDVVSITDDGKKVTFTGLTVGEADITATCGDKTAKALVNVVKRSEQTQDGQAQDGQKTEFTGTYVYNPPTDNFFLEVKFTEDGTSYTDIFAKIGDGEALINGYSDWQQFADLSTGAYYVVVDGKWYDDTDLGFNTFEESGGLGYPFSDFNDFYQLLGRVGFGNEKLKDFYVGEETFLGVKCWVFDSDGWNNIYSKYWVDPSNGCTLKHAGTTSDKVSEVVKYNLNYTEWDSFLLPN